MPVVGRRVCRSELRSACPACGTGLAVSTRRRMMLMRAHHRPPASRTILQCGSRTPSGITHMPHACLHPALTTCITHSPHQHSNTTQHACLSMHHSARESHSKTQAVPHHPALQRKRLGLNSPARTTTSRNEQPAMDSARARTRVAPSPLLAAASQPAYITTGLRVALE
eukprot:1997577-Rhodomonas_salina.2